MQGLTAADVGHNNMSADQMRKLIVAEMSMLPDKGLQSMCRFIHAINTGGEEEMYRCWREELDDFDNIPDELLGNEYVKRYLAEKASLGDGSVLDRSRYDG